jgi:hypothetical protein
VRKIASRETIVVRRLYGNGSNGGKPKKPWFTTTQMVNQTAWTRIAAPLPANPVIEVAI